MPCFDHDLESGNMLIMALAYAQKSGDNSQLMTYASLLDQWTQFLIADSLIPESQISTDDFAGSLVSTPTAPKYLKLPHLHTYRRIKPTSLSKVSSASRPWRSSPVFWGTPRKARITVCVVGSPPYLHPYLENIKQTDNGGFVRCAMANARD